MRAACFCPLRNLRQNARSENGTCFYPRIVETLARSFSGNMFSVSKDAPAPPIMTALAEAFYVTPFPCLHSLDGLSVAPS